MSKSVAFFIRRAVSFTKKTMPPPDRWEAYSPMGTVIPGTKFLALKVPLKGELLNQVAETDRFSPASFIKLVSDRGLKLRGVIDLTYTYKYYNKEEFLRYSIGYRKVFTPGHEVPGENVFQEFAHAVKAFDAVGDGDIIGVHCTHGVNRTGYLICRYMIEEMNFEPDEAITLFDEARGHNLERENYLKDLRNRKRGQSSYDPNFKVQYVEPKSGGPTLESGNRKKVKARHRHAKKNYSEEGQDIKCHHNDEDRETGREFVTFPTEITGIPGNTYNGSHPQNNFVYGDQDCSYNRRYFRNKPSHGSSRHRHVYGASHSQWEESVDNSVPPGSYCSWHDGPIRNFQSQGAGPDPKVTGYYGERFNPMSSHRGTHRRGKNDNHRRPQQSPRFY